MESSHMADLKAQFENAQRSAAESSCGAPQDSQGFNSNYSLSQGYLNTGNNYNGNNSGNTGPAGAGVLDRSNHVISSESSVASGNTSAGSSSLHRLPINKRDRQSTGSTSDEKKDDDEVDVKAQGPNQATSTNPSSQCVTQSAFTSIAPNATNLSNNDASNICTNSSESRAPMVLPMNTPPHPVAEFLFQLTKMLTDNNSDYIEWSNASIYVHDPPGLEKNILPKYFRHSNYSSFQRQMNYFGFRKIAGKGKMAPCSYVNEAAKEDISSLLFIKRKKTGVSGTAARFIQQQNRMNNGINAGMSAAANGITGVDVMNAGNLIGMGAGTVLNGMGAMNVIGNRPDGGIGIPSMGNAGVLGMGTMAGMGAMSGVSTMGQISQFPSLTGGMPTNSALSLNNFHGGSAAAANLYGSTNPKTSNIHESTLLREQQQMLAQLQQAHQSATGANAMGGAGLSTNSNFIPQKLSGGFPGSGALLTNDQGNIYSAVPGAEWNNFTTTPTVGGVGFVQSNGTAGFGGNFSQGAPLSAKDNRAESAANLRLLINQKISLYSNSPSSGANASGTLGVGGTGLGIGIGAVGGGGTGFDDTSNINFGGGAPMTSSIGMTNQVPTTNNGGFQGYETSYELLQRNGMSGIQNMTAGGNPFSFGGTQGFAN